LAAGGHTFQVWAIDAAGNADQSPATFIWTIDTTKPDTTIDSGPAIPTNSTSASFNFSGTDNITPPGGLAFECRLDGGSFVSCTSGKSYTGLAADSHTFEVRAKDEAGNTDSTPAPFTWTIDLTPPSVPTIDSGPTNPTNQTGGSFSFTDTEAGVIFHCQLDGSGYSACSSPKSYSGLNLGSHTFSVKAQDAAGNQSSAASFTWTIDLTPPSVPTIDSGPASPTNITSASFSFTDTGGSVTFLCQLDEGGFTICTSAKGYIGPLNEGSHTFKVKARDIAGNESGEASFTWTIDLTPPSVPTIDSGPASPTNVTSASFSFSDTGGGVTFLCQLDEGGFTTCTSAKGYIGPLNEGSHTFKVKARDAAGNESDEASFTWTIDLIPPDTIIDSMPINPTNITIAYFTFHATDGSLIFECRLDNNSFESCTNPVNYTGPLNEGQHTFTVRAIDAAGNADQSPATFTWTIDTTVPDTTIDSGPANPTNSNSPSFTFHASEFATYECRLDGGGFSACLSPVTYSGLSIGSHTFSVKAQDAAGNQSSATSFTWTIDTTAPPEPVITSTPTNPTNQTGGSFSFTDTEAGVIFLCQLDGSAYSACSSPKSYSGLNQGSHTFSVKAQDAVGNQSSATSFTWTIDTTAPLKPVITSTPTNPTNQTGASFSFTDTEAGVIFLCQLDGSGYSACSSPATYSGLNQGSHTFLVKAQDAVGNQSGPASFSWKIDTTAPPKPTITSTPTNPTRQTKASFKFTDIDKKASFLCQLDGSGYSACSSPKSYSGLSIGSHTFSVMARDAVGHQSAAANFTWTIVP
jgi:hypothetical protein